MMTIDNEIQILVHFLSHQTDYTVTIEHLSIGSVCSSEECWTVSWQETEDNIVYEATKDFRCLFDACQFFVEKRRYFCIGSDFRELLEDTGSESTKDVEIENE